MTAFTLGGGQGRSIQQVVVDSGDPTYSLLREASAQEESTPLPPPSLPFTPFSLQQREQETVPEEERQGGEQQLPTEDGAQALREPGSIEAPNLSEETALPPAADDQSALRPGQDIPLGPQPNEPTTTQGGDQSEGGGSNATTVPSGGRQIETYVKEDSYFRVSNMGIFEIAVDCAPIGANTGGGFELRSPTGVGVHSSYTPYGVWVHTNTWSLSPEAYSSNKVYAVCAKILTSQSTEDGTTAASGSEYPARSVKTSSVRIEPNSQNSVVASCQEGEAITGGGFMSYAFTIGYRYSDPYDIAEEPSIRVYKNYPSGNGWAVEAKSNHQSLPTRLWVFAVCAKIAPENTVNSNSTTIPSVSEQIQSNPRNVPLTVSPNSQNSVVASCQEGEAITAGGWYSQSSDISVHKSYPSGNGWAVEAHNWNPTNARSLIVHAMCARVVPIAQQITPAAAPSSSSPGNETREGESIQELGIPSPTNDTETTTTTPATNGTGGAVTELTPPSSSTEPPLRVEIIANITEAYAPAAVKLDANITGGAPPYSYSWYVPDFGEIDQDRSITQMFFEPGTFNYILTATDSRGKVLNDNVHIIIRERLPLGGDVVAPEPGALAPPTEEEVPLTVKIIPNATQVVAPATIEFDSNVTGGTEPYSYRWELLGGRFTPEYSGVQLVLMFPLPGIYTLVLNVTDSNGRTGSDSIQIIVGGLELPPSDIGEVVQPPTEGGGVLLPPETGGEGQPLGGVSPGTAPGEQSIQEPGVPPPTVHGGDTGRGPQGGVTIEEGGVRPLPPGTIPPTVPGDGPQGGITVQGSVILIPEPKGGFVGELVEVKVYHTDNYRGPSIVQGAYWYFCSNYVQGLGCIDTEEHEKCNPFALDRDLAPVGYHPLYCFAAQYSTPGTYVATARGYNIEGEIVGEGSVQINIRERPQGGAVAPEPGGVEQPTSPPSAPPPSIAPTDEPPIEEPHLIAEIIANATQAYAPATIRLDANITGGYRPYSYSWSTPDTGLIDQDRSITQMFFEPGTFTYVLNATDSMGNTVTDNIQILIQERLPTEGIVAPEPGGVASPPSQEGEVPIPGQAVPPTVKEGGETTGGENTGEGGVTVGSPEGPVVSPPAVPEGEGGEQAPPNEESTMQPEGQLT